MFLGSDGWDLDEPVRLLSRQKRGEALPDLVGFVMEIQYRFPLKSWPVCLSSSYDSLCGETLPAETVYTMLDQMMDTVRDNANKTTCYKTMMAMTLEQLQAAQQVPNPGEPSRDYLSTLPQRVRFAARAKSRWIDSASNFLSHYLLDHKYWMSIWATHFDDFNSTRPGMEICADELDRPLLCEKTWADFSRLAPTQGIGKIWDDISDRAAGLQAVNPTAKLEMTIVEAETDPLTLFGGAILVAHKLYDVVVLYRIVDCSTDCTTVEIHDVRYTGRVLYSDAIEWQYITLVMRWAAQAYMIVRLVFLLAGCYHAAPSTNGTTPGRSVSGWARWKATLTLLLAIPPQVVVYGSFLPVLLYSSAHVIDGVVHYHILGDRMASLSSFFASSAGDMIQMISIYTRNMWVGAFVIRVLVFIETSGGWTPLSGVTGVKGYLLPLLSFGAIFFVLRNSSMQDARVLEANEVEPAATFMVIRAETLDSWKMNAGGVYKDVLTVGLTTVLFIALMLLLHTFKRYVGKRRDRGWWPESIAWSRCDVPYAAGYLWDPSCLVVVWENDVIATVLGAEVARPSIHVPSQLSIRENTPAEALAPTTNTAYILGDLESRGVLMNITFLSDPWNYMTIKFGHTRIHLYQLRAASKEPRKVLHPFSKARFLREFEMKPDEVTLLGTFSASEMKWDRLIMCR